MPKSFLGHIWIGPNPAPVEWMATWRTAHPNWRYKLFDNAYLLSRRFRNQRLIHEYFRRKQYAGVADLMRYEILFEYGGFLPEADSICVNPVDALFTEPRAYTVYEYPNGKTGLVSPILASNPRNPFLKLIIDTLSSVAPSDLNRPWNSTGNGFLKRLIRKHRPDLTIFPSHYFIPEHYKGNIYDGPDTIYARQFWGSTKASYPHSRNRGPQPPEDVDAEHERLMHLISAQDAI